MVKISLSEMLENNWGYEYELLQSMKDQGSVIVYMDEVGELICCCASSGISVKVSPICSETVCVSIV